MTDAEIDAWATAYIQVQLDPSMKEAEPDDNPLWWAIERFISVGTDEVDSDDCWKAILVILERDPPEEVIGILAAGPLEDLIGECGEDFIDRIEAESRSNPHFRHLLGGVWQSSTPAVWERVEKSRDGAW